MRKIFFFALTMLMSIGVWAETAVFSSDHMTGLASDEPSIVSNNIWLGNETDLSADFKIEINGNRQKGLTGQSTITVDATDYVAFKNSNGAQMTITLPEGKVATAVDFYVTTNDATTSGKLSEIDETSCTDEVLSKSDGANPTHISKLIAYKNSFTFTFGTKQVFFIAVVTYQEDVTKYTFGTTRDAADGEVTSNNYMLTPDCSDVTTSSLISTYGTLNTGYKFYNGTSTQLTFGAEATQSYRNLANSTTIKTQNGDSDGAENHGAYVAFDLTIAQNKRLNILSIASAVYPGEKSNYGFEYIVEDADGNQLYKSPSALNISKPQEANDYLDYSANVGAVSALRNLSGKVRVKFLWWCNSSSTVLILKDFNVTATLDEVSETGKEYALKEVKINDVTYDFTIGTTVTESYASLPSVKFIYSVKKVWSDGVKTDTEDEEEVVTPTLVGGNQVATTTKLAEAFTLTFTNIAQFQVVPNAVGNYIDLSSAVVTNCSVENSGANIGSTHNGSTMTIDLKNNTAGDYILQFLSGASGLTATVDINVKGSDYDETKSFNIANTGAFALSEFHAMALKDLPAGNLTLKLTVTSTTGSYAGNYGNFAVYALSSYNQCPGSIDLNKGVYQTARVESAGNVGYCSNGATATYTVYNTVKGTATLHMGMVHYGDGNVTVSVTDLMTGAVEQTKQFTTTSDICKGYDNPTAIELGELTEGLKSIKFTFAISSGFICNYKNVSVTIAQPEPESTWRDIKMDFTTESSFIREVTTTQWDLFTTGIAVAEDGTVSAVETAAENSVATLNAKYHSAQWGLSVPTLTVAVEGPVKISLGSSYYDGTITIKKGEEVLTTFASNIPNKLWSQSNPDCVSYLYMGEAATLTIISSSYCPYIAVEKFETLTENVKIDFRTNPYTVVLPATGVLPAGVTVEANNYHGNQHGTINGKMRVTVAGPTKFTIGGCQFNNNNAVIKDASGNTLATLDTKAAGCDNGFGTYSHFATYYYTGGAQELVIDLGSYCPYIFVEKIAVVDDQMTAEAMDALDEFTGDVTINRALAAGMYNTLCLPFGMTAAEISAKLGTCTIQELNSATLNDNELVLNFTEVDAIVAGKAYLIKPAAAVTTWTMEDVTLSTTTSSTVGASADFIGVLTPTELTASENTLCVGANNRLFYVGETSTLKGLRAYFTVKGAAAGAPARISLGSHMATDLENTGVNADVNKLIEQGRVIIRIDGHDYDLNGRLLK